MIVTKIEKISLKSSFYYAECVFNILKANLEDSRGKLKKNVRRRMACSIISYRKDKNIIVTKHNITQKPKDWTAQKRVRRTFPLQAVDPVP